MQAAQNKSQASAGITVREGSFWKAVAFPDGTVKFMAKPAAKKVQ